ncbi:MAG: hypothetical protein ACK52X_00920 [bacterium]
MSKTLLMTFIQDAESPPEAEDVCGDDYSNGFEQVGADTEFAFLKKI